MKFLPSERQSNICKFSCNVKTSDFSEVFSEISYISVQHIIEIDFYKSQICSLLIAMNHKFAFFLASRS